MPTVIGDLHGLDHYAWVFTSFLLLEIATIPLWGRFADMYGRKKIFLAGMTIFVIGSVLCGASGSMIELIIFRAIQGVGAGCILPVSQTIVADLYTIRERPRISVVFSIVFGFGSIVGPLIGGFFTEHLSWRWVFYVNLPIGIFTIAMVAVVMIEPLQYRHKHRIDWLGMFTLLGWTGLLVFALESGGRDYAWGSPMIVGVPRRERRAARRVRRHRATRGRTADPLRSLQDPRGAGVECDRHRHRHGDVRDAVVPAAVRAGGEPVVGHAGRPDPHPDDAGDGGRVADLPRGSSSRSGTGSSRWPGSGSRSSERSCSSA